MSSHTRGIDVAKHQKHPDWGAVAGAGYEFAYIKATEGVDYVSPTLDAQIDGARAAGMTTGLYHFARPDTNDPQPEADTFARELDRLDSATAGNLPPCLDMERDGDDLPAWIAGFIEELVDLTGRGEVMVYASSSWFEEKLRPDAWADDRVYLWVAHYGATPGEPSYNTEKVVMHQHASDGKVPGIDGNTDLNVALVELGELTGEDGEQQETGPGGLFSGLFAGSWF